MEILLGKTAGFCYGVNNAVKKSEEYVQSNKNKKIYCLGEIVHNKRVVEDLKKEGLIFIDNLSEIDELKNSNTQNQTINSKENNITVIIRAHGEPKSTYEILEKNQINILDLTCPSVLAIHKIVEENVYKGIYIFLIGQKTHPETIGTYGFCDGYCSIIENKEDIDIAFKELLKKKRNKILIVAQTTFSLAKFNEYVEIIKRKIEGNTNKESKIELNIKNTICNTTKLRQEETEKLSKEVDYMIIIGGKNSSNTKKLNDIAIKNCKNTIMVESYKELEERKEELEIIKNANKVGIMAGASTPMESIEEVIALLKNNI